MVNLAIVNSTRARMIMHASQLGAVAHLFKL